LSAAIALLVISALAFCTTALIPGSAASALLGADATPEQVALVTEQLGLDQPLPVRYLYWLREVLQGNLGESVLSQQPVTDLLRDALMVTLELSLGAALIGMVAAIPLGLWLGANNARKRTKPVMFVANLGMAIPVFWIGLMLLLLFAVTIPIFPAGGYVPITEDPSANLRGMVLPWLTLGVWLVVPLLRFTRAATIGVLGEDYIAAAKAKGMSDRRMLTLHALPNAAIPTITFFGLQLGALISGAIITEVIFTLPGMGRLGLNSILSRDYPVVQGVVLTVAAVYVFLNFLVDVTYGLVDPRVRYR
jgi:peptide/nickel transport system permease protein